MSEDTPNARAQSSVKISPAEREPHETHVLVVDDEDAIEDLFKLMFRRETRNNQISLHFAFSGEAAVEYLRTKSGAELVLILSDINMPGMGGLELLEIVSRDFPDLPVLMVTGYGDSATVDTAMSLGAVGVVKKPIDFAGLKAAMLTAVDPNHSG
jgi:CheY-like chemotaxis protein